MRIHACLLFALAVFFAGCGGCGNDGSGTPDAPGGSGCTLLPQGAECTANPECCSNFCDNFECAATPGGCDEAGTACASPATCCSGVCADVGGGTFECAP